jgi:hypothetical protein
VLDVDARLCTRSMQLSFLVHLSAHCTCGGKNPRGLQRNNEIGWQIKVACQRNVILRLTNAGRNIGTVV